MALIKSESLRNQNEPVSFGTMTETADRGGNGGCREMHDTILPRRARTSARIALAANGLPYAALWPDIVPAHARGASDPMTELFGRQQKDLKHALERAEFAERI